jgi:profilin
MDDIDTLGASGFRLGGERYYYVGSTKIGVHGRKGPVGVHCAKSKTALLLGIYDWTLVPGQASCIVEGMADYLTANNC